jgi:hypothetical protein
MSSRSTAAIALGAVVFAAALLSACQPAANGASGAPGATTVASPTPQATKPIALPRPSSVPTDGSCEDEETSCLGVLTAGHVYTTKIFEPPITFTPPTSEWVNIADHGGDFGLLSTSSPGDAILFFRDPRVADAEVGTTIPDLAASLAANPNFDVTPASSVTVGGLDGVVLDIRLASGAVNDDPGCPVQVCVRIFRGDDPNPDDPYPWHWDWGLAGPETDRLYLLTAPEGVLAVFVDSIDGETFDLMTTTFDQIAPTLSFGSS